MHIMSHKSPCVVEGWGRLWSFPPTLHSLSRYQTRGFPTLPCQDIGWCRGCSRSEQLRSRVAVTSPSRLAGTGCDTCDQSLSPSPTPRLQTASNTHEIIANCHPKTLLARDLHFHQLDKYGLAEPETRWCNSPSRASSSLTFKSEHTIT